MDDADAARDGDPSPRVRTVETPEGDAVTVRPYESGDFEGVVATYEAFPADQRAMGIPPLGGREAVAEWVEGLVDRGRNVVADVGDGGGDGVVGHAVLVPADDPAPELAVFVAPAYQNRGVGTALCEALVDAAVAAGHERIVLSVADANRRAQRVYEKLGFEVASDPSEKLWREMVLELA